MIQHNTIKQGDRMNRILDKIIEERKGHYCHALEVNDVIELEGIVESVIEEFNSRNETIYTDVEFIEFFRSMEIYYLGRNKEEEERVYNFDFNDYIKDTI